jgi:hypothetical protein
LARFRCSRCGNAFDSAAPLAVCNGVSVKADAAGNPVDREGDVLPPASPLVLDGLDGAPVPIEVACGSCGHAEVQEAPFARACSKCGAEDLTARARPIKGVHSHEPTLMRKVRGGGGVSGRRAGRVSLLSLAQALAILPGSLLLSALSDYMEAQLWKYVWRAVATDAFPTSVYVALFTAAPGDSGGGTEVSGGAYARVAVVRSPTGSARWSDPGATSGLTDNLDVLTFPTATANWGTVVATAVFDGAAAGNLWIFGNLATSKAVNIDDTAKFAVGALDLSIA